MIQLLKLDQNTFINPEKIIQITVLDLNKLRQERRQNHITADQREQMNDKFWEVSIYLISNEEGLNPQRYAMKFKTQTEAQTWINGKFQAVIVDYL